MRYIDANGVHRFVRVTVEGIERTHAATGCDLFNFPDCFDGVGQVELLRAVWCLQSTGESWADWFNSHRGDAQDDAIKSMMKAVEFFYPVQTESERKESSESAESTVNIREQTYQFAGFLGVDPFPFSLRQIVQMVEGKVGPKKGDSVIENHSLTGLAAAMGARVKR